MKNTFFISCMAFAALLGSCRGESDEQATAQQAQIPPAGEDWNGYRNIAPEDIPDNIVRLLADDWMLITSGDTASYNTMTASWGALGRIWERPAAFMMVRNTRHTYGFLQRNDRYTLSFFGPDHKDTLTLLGTRSGRDGDKVAASGLTPMPTPGGSMSFGEARMIIECEKLFEDALDPRSIFDDRIAGDYIRTDGERHVLFIGAITDVWIKDDPQPEQ